MRLTFIALLVVTAVLLAAYPAHAGPLTIAPTTLEIEPQRQSAMLTVTNDSDQPVDLQFRAYAWSQSSGGESLTPTGDLAISPAIVTVAPHKKQVFRILRVRTTQIGTEPSYRLRLNELPRPGAVGVVVNLEFSLPVFVSTKGATPTLAWSREGATVSVFNTGNRRVRLGSLALGDESGGSSPIRESRSTYILAGATRVFPLASSDRPVPPGAHLVGTTDFGPVDVASTTTASR